jgi:hypothetical protein
MSAEPVRDVRQNRVSVQVVPQQVKGLRVDLESLILRPEAFEPSPHLHRFDEDILAAAKHQARCRDPFCEGVARFYQLSQLMQKAERKCPDVVGSAVNAQRMFFVASHL